MCNSPATSKEHVPPRCLFPEQKDSDIDLRKALITVPSCDAHNMDKSQDDEFLLICLAGIIGNNAIGYRHKFTKVNRAIKRNAVRFLEAMDVKYIDWLEIAPDKFIDVIWGTPDYDRLSSCFDHIVRGLHFHLFGCRFDGQTKTILGFTHDSLHNPTEFKRFIKAKVDAELMGKAKLGSNPEVFTYQFTDPDQFGLYLAHLQFYGGLDIYVSLIPAGDALPKNFAMELIAMGIPTVVSFNGEQYQFNKEEELD